MKLKKGQTGYIGKEKFVGEIPDEKIKKDKPEKKDEPKK